MGLALDTVLASASATTTFIPATVAAGDTFTVRSFASTATAKLEQIVMNGAVGSGVQIKSPLLHDNVRGITLIPGAEPSSYMLPSDVAQPLQSQDTLAVLLAGASGTAAEVAAAYTVAYSDLSGAAANLASWGDISGNIEQVKPITVGVTANATPGQWNDTVITTTEDLMRANRWYAILGYVVSTACAVVALRGTDTSNLHIGGPGTVLGLDTSDYFVRATEHHGTPHIPVINSANKSTTFVSVADFAASTAVKVQLIAALLSSSYSG